jgi:hypothetical protein
MATPCTLFIPGAGAYEFVSKEYQAYIDRVRNLSDDAAVDIDRLQAFAPDFASVPWVVDTSVIDDIVVPDLTVDASNRPTFRDVQTLFNEQPPASPNLSPLDDGSGIRAVGDAPDPDYGRFTSRTPATPVLNYPNSPGPAPTLDIDEPPEEPTLTFPFEPDLRELSDIGQAPELTLPTIPEIPDFAPPQDELQDIYFADHNAKTGELDTKIHEFAQADTGLVELRPAFARVIEAINTENTGLPTDVQQEIFDAGRERLREDQLRSEREAEERWVERGHDLPGAAVAASIIEARRTRQIEAGRLNRELTVETHRQAIENMRYVIDRAVQYEGQLMNIFLQLDENARTLAYQHFEVMRGIYNAYIAIHELNIRAYTAQINVYEAQVRVELAKLEAYRTQLETIRLEAEVNRQEVEIYEAQIRAQQARVDVYNSQIQGFRGRIDAELAKVEAFRAKVEGFAAEMRGIAERVNVYEAEIRGEEARTRAYSTQVEAYRARVQGYAAQIDAEATRTRSLNDVVQSQASIYNSQVDAWATGVNADTQRVERAVQVHRANIEGYLAELNNEETSARMRSLGFDKELEQARVSLAAQIGNIDRALKALESASSLELERLRAAAQINAQLAAASMASLSLSASLSGNDSWSASSSTSCSTNFSGIV